VFKGELPQEYALWGHFMALFSATATFICGFFAAFWENEAKGWHCKVHGEYVMVVCCVYQGRSSRIQDTHTRLIKIHQQTKNGSTLAPLLPPSFLAPLLISFLLSFLPSSRFISPMYLNNYSNPLCFSGSAEEFGGVCCEFGTCCDPKLFAQPDLNPQVNLINPSINVDHFFMTSIFRYSLTSLSH
jgi:hypothetical protein